MKSLNCAHPTSYRTSVPRIVRSRKTKYKYVSELTTKFFNTDRTIKNSYRTQIKKKGMKAFLKETKTIREAALAADMWLIKHHFEPVNILKRL